MLNPLRPEIAGISEICVPWMVEIRYFGEAGNRGHIENLRATAVEMLVVLPYNVDANPNRTREQLTQGTLTVRLRVVYLLGL